MARRNRPSPANDPTLDRDRYLLRQAGATTPHDLLRDAERRARTPTEVPRIRPTVGGEVADEGTASLVRVLASLGLVDDKTTTGPAIAYDSIPAVNAASRVFDTRNYGAIGDDDADDTAAMQACADACLAANGVYFHASHMVSRISDTLNLRYIVHVRIEGVVKMMHTTDPGVIVGGDSITTVARNIYVQRVRYGGTQSNVSIRVTGLLRSRVEIGMCDYLELTSAPSPSTDVHLSYNDFFLHHCLKIHLHETGPSGDAVNENRFWGGKATEVIMDKDAGEGGPNHNRFYGNNYEHGIVTINSGHANTFEGCRFEYDDCTAYFGPGTLKNRIVQSFYNNHAYVWPTTISVTDEGFDNVVTTEILAHSLTDVVWRIDSAARTTDVASGWDSPDATRKVIPGLRKVSIPAGGSVPYFDTGVFPLEAAGSGGSGTPQEGRCSLRNLLFLSDQAIWRPRVFVYDADRVALDGTSTEYMDLHGTWSWSASGYYTFGSNRGIGRISFRHPDVRYARVQVLTGTLAAATWLDFAQLVAYVQAPSGRQIVDFIRRQSARPLASDAAPAKSLLHLGDGVRTTTGFRPVVRRTETTLTGASAASDTTLTVASITGIASGDLIAVELDDGTTHWTTVNGAPSGSTVTITTGVASAAAVGRQVVASLYGAIV